MAIFALERCDKGQARLYIQNLEHKESVLKWSGSTCPATLIIRCEYGKEFVLDDNIMQVMNQKISDSDIDSGAEVQVCENVFVVFSTESVKNYKNVVAPSRYALFPCSLTKEGGKRIYTIYEEIGKTANTQCDVQARVRISIRQERKRKWIFLFKFSRWTRYWVRIDKIPNYKNGSLFYRIPNMKCDYPLSSRIIEASEEFYIDSEIAPQFEFYENDSNGYHIDKIS